MSTPPLYVNVGNLVFWIYSSLWLRVCLDFYIMLWNLDCIGVCKILSDSWKYTKYILYCEMDVILSDSKAEYYCLDKCTPKEHALDFWL